MKEWEAYSCGEEIDGRVVYGGWFVFIGKWSPNRTGKDAFNFPKQEEFFYFTDSFPNATKLFGPDVLAVEFSVQVPKAPDYVSDWA
jgi:hypothetical protein